MRIKFEKGFTPERMAKSLVDFIYDHNVKIGSVNIYAQAYDDGMKPARFVEEGEFYICKPSDAEKAEYADYIAQMRRGKIKLVCNGTHGR